MQQKHYYRKPFIKYSILRVLLFLTVWFAFIYIHDNLLLLWVDDVFPEVNTRSPLFFTLTRTSGLLISLLLIWFFRKRVDRRPVFGEWFSFTSRRIDLLVGFFAGGLLLAVSSFILGQLGYIEFSPGNLEPNIGLQLVLMFFVAALFEEVLFRGYVLGNLLEDLHPFVALLISAVLFMVFHKNNPNIETLPIVNLFLAGIMLGIPFLFTKNLWFPLGLHWGWNLFQGPVFGFEVSGIATQSLFHQEILDQSLWTGGSFGFEGSLLATIILISTSILLYIIFRRFKPNENL